MTWNYRILDFGTHLALHEVYYTNGVPSSYTENAVSFGCDHEDGPQGIINSLKLALVAGEKPVIVVADQWPETSR